MEKKEDMFKYLNSNEVTIYRMNNKASFLILSIFILIVTSILRHKYKVDAYGFVEFIMIVDMILIGGAIGSGLGINNTIKISKDFIKIGSLKPIEWKNINKIGFQTFSAY